MFDAVPAQTDRLNTALAGRYRIERHLGEGGMATVFLAEDLKHKRKVALKVLKPELAAVLGAERFVQEITTTASLQHPHILALFDSGTADGFLFYVMPWIDGETLREKLSRETQLGVDEAVRIAREVLDALEYAHQHGIVHRDIKPENILLHGGHALVADFGIALAVSAAAGGRMTETGLSLGTPHYMSPEQATAEKEITARSDVYSVGSVLFEMLSGQPPHHGGSAQQIIMKIIAEPVEAVTKFRKAVPPNVAAAVAKALEKLPADRFESAKAFGEALGNPAYTNAAFTGAAAGAHSSAPRVFSRSFIGMSVLAAIALAGWAWTALRPTASPVQHTRFTLAFSDSARLRADVAGGLLALSPSGLELAYVGGGPVPRIFLRSLDGLASKPLPGTENARNPQFSPDGKWLAFTVDSRLKRLPLSGGPVATIADDAAYYSWGDGDIVVIARPPGPNAGLWLVSAVGGLVKRLTLLDTARRESVHVFPHVLPGGSAVVFAVRKSDAETDELAAVGLKDGLVTRFGIRGTNPRYVATGHILFGRVGGSVSAVPFDEKRLHVTGPEVPVIENVMVKPGVGLGGATQISVARNGMLVYLPGGTDGQVVFVDRQGRFRPVRPEAQQYADVRYSPNGKRLAMTVHGSVGSADVWVQDLGAGTRTRLTNDGKSDHPEWTPDGRKIVWRFTGDSGLRDLRWQLWDAGGAAETLLQDAGAAVFAPSGKFFLTTAFRPATSWDIDIISLDSARRRTPFVNTPAAEFAPKVSHDSRWLAYVSNESGSGEIYVRAISGHTGLHQISIDGGFEPVWAPSGRELFYRAGGKLISAAITTTPELAVVRRDVLFEDVFQLALGFANYDISPDGKTFVMVKPVGTQEPPVVVLGWLDEFRERMRLAAKK
jgi:serine/threonine-protein kinase